MQQQEAEDLRHLQVILQYTREKIIKEAKKGDSHTLDGTVQSHVPVLTSRYVHTTRPLSLIEAEIRHLWHTVIEAAKHWDAANPKQDTIVRYMLSARARGTLTRPLEDVGPDGAGASEGGRLDATPFPDGGMFWSDLPLFGQSLVEEWTQRFYLADYDHEHNVRPNLAAFIGRLISVGIWHGPAACALSLFRETLETTRPLEQVIMADNDDNGSSARPLIETLVTALLQMLYHSEGNVINPSNDSSHIANARLPPDTSALGQLAVQAGLSSAGFSSERWRFWIKRLEDLAGSETAESCLNVMMSSAENIYGPLAGKLRFL